MKKNQGYSQHAGKVIDAKGKFAHVMAISLDPRSKFKAGVARCIKSREGDVAVSGFIDRSVLHKIHGDSLEHFTIGNALVIKDQAKILKKIAGDRADFLGLEDPDIWIDEKKGLTHLYFTMPIRARVGAHLSISLGHAVGKSLNSLVMTKPVLLGDPERDLSAKEVSIAPINKKGFRYNLIESSDKRNDIWYSTVRVAIARDMGKPWKFGETVFHPVEHHIEWAGGHASPGPLLPKTFLNVGAGRLLGVMNGREANRYVHGETKYGMFSVGLFIYNYEKGKIEWVSPRPFIIDSAARTITFASQFIDQGNGAGILYAHVDDSFVRAYTLNAAGIKKLLPRQ